MLRGFPGGTVVKNPPADTGDTRDVSLIPGLGRSPKVGNGKPFQYSYLENSRNRRAWQAIVHEVTKNQTWLSNSAHTHTHTHTHIQAAKYPKELSSAWGHMWNFPFVPTTSSNSSYDAWFIHRFQLLFHVVLYQEMFCSTDFCSWWPYSYPWDCWISRLVYWWNIS